jgi:DNA gyrase inhibitor GyrI
LKKPASVSAAAGLAELAPARTENDLSGAKTMEIKIVDFPQTQVAMLQHRGNPDRVNDSAAKFIAWRKSSGLSPVHESSTFGIGMTRQPHPQTPFVSISAAVSLKRYQKMNSGFAVAKSTADVTP